MGKNKRGVLSQNDLQKQIDNLSKDNTAKVYDDTDKFIVIFKSNRAYTLDKDGNIVNIDTNYKAPEKRFLAQLSDNNYGTETNPYELNCIEDLLDLSFTVNGLEVVDEKITIKSSFDRLEGKYVKLTRNLNFKSELSYEDSERKDYGDINYNDNTETIIKELTTGKGWIPIGFLDAKYFLGEFNGNGNSILNIHIDYENSDTQKAVGLFGKIGRGASIKNLTLSGEIKNNWHTGGIVAESSEVPIEIENCINKANIKGYNMTGGIMGIMRGNGQGDILNCSNYGTIETTGSAYGYKRKWWNNRHYK